MNNNVEIFENIVSVDVHTSYNYKTKKLETKFYFDTDESATYDWDMKYQEFIKKLSVGYIDETIINKFIDINEILSIKMGSKTIYINKYNKLKLKHLRIYCKKNKFLNISFPRLNLDYLPKVCNQIDTNRRSVIIDKYVNNLIDSIIVFPSNITSEIEFYENLKEEGTNNVLSCFNYKPHAKDENFLDISDLITEIIEDFYENNQYQLDGFYKNSKKIVITFSNNRSIIIYDRNYTKQIETFLEQVQNDLIDIKTKNINRKVYRYGKNNNGENGKFM